MHLGFWCRSLSSGIKRLIDDRRGATSTAVAALISIAVILILVSAVSSPKGAEDVFWAEFAIAKLIADLLGIGDYLKDFEEMLKYLQGTELWPLIVSILSIVCMAFSLLVAFAGTKAVVGTTTRVLAWRRGRREKRKKIIEEDRRQFELWREELEREDEEDSLGLTGAFKRLSVFNRPEQIGHSEGDVASELLDQARLRMNRIILLHGGPLHRKSEGQLIAWLKEQDEPILRQGEAEPDPEMEKHDFIFNLLQYGYPDYSTPYYIIECKVGADYEVNKDALDQYKKFMELSERVNKRLLYWFNKHPQRGSKWWKIIHELEECGYLVGYGDEKKWEKD